MVKYVTRTLTLVPLFCFQECNVVCKTGTHYVPSVDPLRHVRQPSYARKGRLRRTRAERGQRIKVERGFAYTDAIFMQLQLNPAWEDAVTFPACSYSTALHFPFKYPITLHFPIAVLGGISHENCAQALVH